MVRFVLVRDVFFFFFFNLQVMCGVMHLHDVGVIHKDIKVNAGGCWFGLFTM